MIAPGNFVATNGPVISLSFAASLSFLGATGTDFGEVINAVKSAVAASVNATDTDAEIAPSDVVEIVAAVDGVSSCGSVLINGSASTFTESGASTPYNLSANDVIVEVGIAYE